MVAAMCMVLYGYDASVYNSVQGSDNWLAYFDLDTVREQGREPWGLEHN
jgi:hypothetical protein